MRLLLLILLCISLFLGSCFWGTSLLFLDSDSKDKPNLVPNNSFEKADSRNPELPDGWLIVSTLTDSSEPVALDSTIVQTGKKSLMITNSKKDMYIVSDAFQVNYTGGYYTKFSIKSIKPMQKPARLYLWAYDSSGNKRNSFRKSIKAKSDWKRASISAGFLKNSVSFARVAIFIPKDSGNTIYIDDVGCFLVHQFTKE